MYSNNILKRNCEHVYDTKEYLVKIELDSPKLPRVTFTCKEVTFHDVRTEV